MKNNIVQYTIPLVIEEQDANEMPDIGVLNTIIGQNEARQKLNFYIESNSPETPIPTLLFTGSQGLGKSFMAAKVAKALGRPLVEVNCGTIKTPEDFVEGVLIEKVAGNQPKTIFLDESHELSSSITTILLTLLNPNNNNKNFLVYKNFKIEYDFSKLNIIMATTDAHKMFRPLLNRCSEIYFNLYDNDELYKILCHYLPNVDVKCDKETLAYACRGRGREAYLLAQNINRYCMMKKIKIFKDKDWKEMQEIFGINKMGLKSHEVELLRVIKEFQPVSLMNLAAKMGLNTSNIDSEVETRVRELGLINNAARGRVLTHKGEEYLG